MTERTQSQIAAEEEARQFRAYMDGVLPGWRTLGAARIKPYWERWKSRKPDDPNPTLNKGDIDVS